MTKVPTPKEGRTWCCAPLVLRLYRWWTSETVRLQLRHLVIRMEGGPAGSLTIRQMLRSYFQIDVGLYSAGPVQGRPRRFQPGTTIGRYAALADTARTFTRNHTTTTKSTHGLFDNPLLGKVKTDLIPWGKLVIGHGVWIGHSAIILPPTERIGEGAVISAGSVVCSNVAPYAIVAGFPARVIGYRYSQAVIAELLKSRWWELSPGELARQGDAFRGLTGGARQDAKSPELRGQAGRP